jgi:hypothetical protein
MRISGGVSRETESEGRMENEEFFRIENLMVDRDDVQKWRRERSEVSDNAIISILRGGRSEFERTCVREQVVVSLNPGNGLPSTR